MRVFRILALDYESAWVNLMKVRKALCLAKDAEPQLEGDMKMDVHIGGHVRPINDRERDLPRTVSSMVVWCAGLCWACAS